MKEKLYADYVKRARAQGKKLISSEDFFAAVGQIVDLLPADPRVTGEMSEDGWELLLS